MACYPFFAWYVGGSYTVDITIGATTVSRTIDLSAKYGWGNAGPVAGPDSALDALRDAIASHPAAPTVTAVYLVTSAGSYSIVGTSVTCSANVSVTFASVADARVFGYSSALTLFVSATARLNNYNPAGVCAPCPRTFSPFSKRVVEMAVSGSRMAQQPTVTTGWGSYERSTFILSLVPSANIWADFANRTEFATMAGRDVADTNNLYELMADAMGENKGIYVWESAARSYLCYNDSPGNGDTEKIASPIDEPRYWSLGPISMRKQ